jgi:nucleoside-diphosphate-sugar epimerase
MRILVTGGRGLIGEATVRELVGRGHEVTSFQRNRADHPPEVRQVLGDITDPEAVAAAVAGQEAVVHSAAVVDMFGEWEAFERVNVDGTRTVLDAAAVEGVGRFVFISSPSVAHYGEPLVGAEAGEADPSRTHGHYSTSKAMAERLVLTTPADMAVMALRPHLVWGPGDTQLAGRIIDRARSGRLFLIDGGTALIDTLYVDNAATAIAQAVERCHLPALDRRALVVTNGEPRTVRELMSRMAVAGGAPVPTRSVPFAVARRAGKAAERAWRTTGASGEPPITEFLAEQLATAHWFDQREVRELLRWRPEVSLDEGFTRLAESFRTAGH